MSTYVFVFTSRTPALGLGFCAVALGEKELDVRGVLSISGSRRVESSFLVPLNYMQMRYL